MKSKVITLITNNALLTKIEIVCGYYKITSESEINTIYSIFKAYNNAHFYLGKHTRIELCQPINLSVSAFNQSIHRLIKKDLIRKIDGKNHCLNPIFADIDIVDQVSFRILE